MIDTQILYTSEAGWKLGKDEKGLIWYGQEKDIRIPEWRLDAGVDGQWLYDSMPFESYEDFRTWTLPELNFTADPIALPKEELVSADDKVTVLWKHEKLTLWLEIGDKNGWLALRWGITGNSSEKLWINGALLALSMEGLAKADFPASLPTGTIDMHQVNEGQVIANGMSSAFIHLDLEGCHVNAFFLDSHEKFSSGLRKQGVATELLYVPSLELELNEGEVCEIATLYLGQTIESNPYHMTRDFVAALGYRPAVGGITDGVLYSCHPHGTMDGDFPDRKDLFEYAEYLPTIKEMGVDHVWLLPVFDHGDAGVYHSTDQAIIDPRYGGDDATAAYVKKAHELGLTVSFDYVPHGPNKDVAAEMGMIPWCSRRRNGELQEEWECVSLDYNHPGYLDYTIKLVEDHIRRFDIDGARIDCAMGGLSNWQPQNGVRPSSSNLRAGRNITEAIRRGFMNQGKTPLTLPENFHPLPTFYDVTDVFYGFNLYRVFDELGSIFHSDPKNYVERLVHWLSLEQQVTPNDLSKLRFLGNHDTVSWVWQADRATNLYGVEGAKALWAVMSLIDGMVMIYQGDEDPAIAHREGPDLRAWFKELFSWRKQLAAGGKTDYINIADGVISFVRYAGDKRYLILVNLTNEAVICDHDLLNGSKALKGEVSQTRHVMLDAYAYNILLLA